MEAPGPGSTYDAGKDEERSRACAFVRDAGMRLHLPQLTIASAVAFFHRFYCRYKFSEFDTYTVGATCLFLASKVEETLKKLKDVVHVTHVLRYRRQIRSQEEFDELKTRILEFERIVMQALGFDFSVEHPYRFLLRIVKSLHGNKNLAQVAWNFVNDSLRTTLCVQYPPRAIAAASIYLSAQYIGKPLAETNSNWKEILDTSEDDLEDISNQILDVYDKSESPLQKVDPRKAPSRLPSKPSVPVGKPATVSEKPDAASQTGEPPIASAAVPTQPQG